jgi:hypothetical protein
MPAAPGAPARPNDTPAPAAPGVRRDDVQISSQARELQKIDTTSRASASEIAPDRLREVLGRVSGGYYDQPQVRNEVIRRIAKDL